LIDNLLAEEKISIDGEAAELLSLTLQNAQIQSILTVFIVVVLISFSNVIMSRGLTRPLRKIIRGVDEFAKGNLDFKISVETNDELGELSTHFNEMAQQLKDTMRELKEAKLVLEKKVEERTLELKEAATSLEDSKDVLEIKIRARTLELEELSKGLDRQVKEKTKELQEKIKDLEVFQRLSLGRELKMVELKEEIKKLKDQLK
jgi:HAMP domain-containing protein